jgi:cysteine desulfurase/selenocysteine lyase
MVMPYNFDFEKTRADFPILSREVHGRRLVYLDNAATTLKPQCVLDAVTEYYTRFTANIHRGVHLLSEEATALYESTRTKVKSFLNAESTSQIIFTSGTTQSINLVAQSFGRSRLKEGDEIIVSHMEHHSNIVPWQMLCEEKGCVLKVIPIDDSGTLDLNAFYSHLNERTKLVALVYVSNSLGTINPVEQVIKAAHERHIPVLLDGAQAVAHMEVDVQKLDCDFFVFSAHKLFGPTGVGVLYGKKELLESMPPVMGGGDMIRSVTFAKTTYAALPARLEAGTPNISGVIGLGAAIDYVQSIGLKNIEKYEQDLLDYGTERLASIPGVRLIGTALEKASILSFVVEGIHPHDLGSLLDQEGVAIRTGHHCTQPVMARFGIPATARASLSFYNSKQDIDALVSAVQKAKELFS